MWTLVFCTLTALCSPTAAQTTSVEQALDPASVSVNETDETELKIRELADQLEDRGKALEAVDQLVAISGDEVEALFQHVVDRALKRFDDQLIYIWEYKDDAGNKAYDVYPLFTPAPTEENTRPQGQPLATNVASGDLKSFREYRKARKPITTAIAVIGLYNKNDEKRAAAAKRVGDRRESSATEALVSLIEKDPNSKIRFLAEESYQLITLAGKNPKASEPEDLVAAAQTLGKLKSIRGMDLLIEKQQEEDASKNLIQACTTSIARIEKHQSLTTWISHIFRGFSLGTILVLMALGLAITFGLMGVINMAHGEMLMIGAIAAWATFEFMNGNLFTPDSFWGLGKWIPQPDAGFIDANPAWKNWYYVIAFPVSLTAAAIAGWLTEVLIVRHLYKRPLDSLLATIGVSFILIQSVRLWKGDNLSMGTPSWFNGGWEIVQDVVLPYNRLFLIGLCSFCLLAIVVLFRFTKIGLLMRATVQNREMAQALGVNTRRVDQFTFAFGAALAGLAGYGLVLTTNVSPQMGQGYIVDSFLTTVVGGVGKLPGVIYAGLSVGFSKKLLEPLEVFTEPFRFFDAGWATVATIVLVILFMLKRPGGIFPEKGRAAKNEAGGDMPWLSKSSVSPIRRDLYLGGVLAVVLIGVIPTAYATGFMSPSTVNKLGQYLCFAIMAIGLDLVWGYLGALSLCQGLFFALGGYCMGFYLINHGPKDIDNIPTALAITMSNAVADGAATKQPPAYLVFFEVFPVAILLGLLITALIAFVIGAAFFKSRIKGVYFSILTQAVIVAFWNVFVKNDMKLGGTNGLTNFTQILGFQIADKPFPEAGQPYVLNGQTLSPEEAPSYLSIALQQTRFWLYITTVFCMFGAVLIARMLVSSRFGRVMVAIRDDETRLRFLGYQAWIHQSVVFVIGALFAGAAGMLFAPQKGIITPTSLETYSSILVVVWVAFGGRATIWGPVLGAITISVIYDRMTSFAPEYWMYVLGGLFIAVPLFFPGGLMSLPSVIRGLFNNKKNSDNQPTQLGQEVPA